MMKFALPSRENQIDDHFGHCKHFTIFTLNRASEIVAEEKLQPGDGSWYESNVASQLAAMGVETMLAGNIGAGTINVLEAHGIRVVRGCSGGGFPPSCTSLVGGLNLGFRAILLPSWVVVLIE